MSLLYPSSSSQTSVSTGALKIGRLFSRIFIDETPSMYTADSIDNNSLFYCVSTNYHCFSANSNRTMSISPLFQVIELVPLIIFKLCNEIWSWSATDNICSIRTMCCRIFRNPSRKVTFDIFSMQLELTVNWKENRDPSTISACSNPKVPFLSHNYNCRYNIRLSRPCLYSLQGPMSNGDRTVRMMKTRSFLRRT